MKRKSMIPIQRNPETRLYVCTWDDGKGFQSYTALATVTCDPNATELEAITVAIKEATRSKFYPETARIRVIRLEDMPEYQFTTEFTVQAVLAL